MKLIIHCTGNLTPTAQEKVKAEAQDWLDGKSSILILPPDMTASIVADEIFMEPLSTNAETA